MKIYIFFIIIFLQIILYSQEREYFTFEEALLKPDSVKVLNLGDYPFHSKTHKIFKLDARIKLLTNLERLEFTCNYIDSIPAEISELENLEMVTILDVDNIGAPSNNCKLNFPNTFIKLSRVKNLAFLYIPFVKFNLPIEVKYLTNLKTLSLVYNNLNFLPNEISQMKGLKFLDIRFNKLNDLPNSISQLDSLLNLDLSANQFDSIPKVVFNVRNLEYLNFSYNELKSIPKEIGNLKNLKRLDLKKNYIKEIPNELFNCEDLEFLDLSDNNISNIPVDVFALKKLTKLDISGNNISERQVQILKDYLKNVEVIN